jgi:hypothetical protein
MARKVDWKLPCHSYCCAFLVLQRNLLCKHHVARRQAAGRQEAPSDHRAPGLVNLENVCRSAVADAITLSRIASHYDERLCRIELLELFRRKPTSEEILSS